MSEESPNTRISPQTQPSLHEQIADAVRTVRETTPLAQSFTNFVTINLVANAQLAAGGAAAMSFMHGAQDGQKFIGVLFLGMAFCSGQTGVAGVIIPVWLMILCSTIMGVGTSVGGERIIKSVGQDMVRLEKYQGFSADLSSALCLLVMTVLGIPVSTTHTKTSAIMGVGAVRRLSAINFGVVRDMMLTWVFTFPGCGIISYVMAKLFMLVF